jgi:uncharacterized protein (DUF1330 family)
MDHGYHLFVRSFSTDHHFRQFSAHAGVAVRELGCTVDLAASLHQCRFLEPGSDTGHVWAAQCPTRAALDALWDNLSAGGLIAALDDGRAPQCLAIPGLPVAGLPDPSIPTAANITPPASAGPTAYMIIEGAVTDQVRIDTYRDVILPMIGERGGYYTVFAFADQIKILSGIWGHQLFIISRWPDLATAKDFWFSDRYQTVAIPRRLGAGTFDVALVEAGLESNPATLK